MTNRYRRWLRSWWLGRILPPAYRNINLSDPTNLKYGILDVLRNIYLEAEEIGQNLTWGDPVGSIQGIGDLNAV